MQKSETLCVSARGSPYSCGYWQTYFNATLLNSRIVNKAGAMPNVMAANGPLGKQQGVAAKLIRKQEARAVQATKNAIP